MKVQKIEPILEAFQMTQVAASVRSKWPDWLQQAWQKRDCHLGSLSVGPGPEDRLVFRHENGDAVIVHWGDWFLYNPNAPDVLTLSRVPNPVFCEHYDEVHEADLSLRDAVKLLLNRYRAGLSTAPNEVLKELISAHLDFEAYKHDHAEKLNILARTDQSKST